MNWFVFAKLLSDIQMEKHARRLRVEVAKQMESCTSPKSSKTFGELEAR